VIEDDDVFYQEDVSTNPAILDFGSTSLSGTNEVVEVRGKSIITRDQSPCLGYQLPFLRV